MTEQTEIVVETEATTESTDVAVPEENVAVTAYQPTEGMNVEKLMHVALERDGNIDVIKELVQLRNDEMDRQSARDFQVAYAEFHRRCPAIPRDCKGKPLANRDGGGTNTLMYAGLETIQRVVDPLLGELGFSYSFTVPKSSEKSLIVECYLWHESGHSRTSQMPVPISPIPQATGGQQFAGARTTGKRLTLSDVLGIATEDEDHKETAQPVLTEDQLYTLRELMKRKQVNASRVIEFAEVTSLADILQSQFGMLKRFLETRKDPEVSE